MKRFLSIILPLLLASCSVDFSEDLVADVSRAAGEPSGGIITPIKRSRDFHASLGGDHVIDTRKGDRYVHSQSQSFRDGVTGATTYAATRASARVGLAQEGTKQVELKEGTKRIISGNEKDVLINESNNAVEALKIAE